MNPFGGNPFGVDTRGGVWCRKCGQYPAVDDEPRSGLCFNCKVKEMLGVKR